MLRVVIDTNVVVSALLSPHGNPAKILDLVTVGKLRVCYSPAIIAEYMEVLSRPRFSFNNEDQDEFINGVRRFGFLAEPPISDALLPDESDRAFYDAAMFCEAILVTGNIKHYPAESFIVTPTELLSLVEG